MLRGSIDELGRNKVGGWAFNTDQPEEQLIIVIAHEARELAKCIASVRRPDLAEAGLGQGDHAFQMELPEGFNALELTYSAVSEQHGQLELLTKRERMLSDALRHAEKGISDLGKKVDSVQARVDAIQMELSSGKAEDVRRKAESLESRISDTEVFLVRMDEMIHKLAREHSKRRKRFFGLF
jgi:hypothetical protein